MDIKSVFEAFDISFNSKSGSIDRVLYAKKMIKNMIVSIPKVVRLIGFGCISPRNISVSFNSKSGSIDRLTKMKINIYNI